MSGQYPNTFYRVSTKAIIRNTKGEVLLAKEKGSQWSLPGGGLDHGESVHDALKRELYEEAMITAPFNEKLVATESMFVDDKDAWLLWLVFEIEIEDDFEFGIGEDADEVEFLDPKQFKDSEHRSERLVYKFALEGSYQIRA
jgi:ADP-ribose pyrophosphatase YjhB (NUDIX family)